MTEAGRRTVTVLAAKRKDSANIDEFAGAGASLRVYLTGCWNDAMHDVHELYSRMLGWARERPHVSR